jgi:hypothetical protein
MSQSKLEAKVLELENVLKSIDYQLANNQPYHSATQILIWRRSRRQIHRSLEFFRKSLAALMDAREGRKLAKKKSLVSQALNQSRL